MPGLNFTFQESSPLISYSPGWTAIYDHNDPFKSSYNGIFRPTTTKGANATISFLGTGISIFGAIRNNHGNYSASLDGGLPFVGSGFSDPFRFNFSLWNSLDLPYARHTAVLTNIPVAATRNFVDIDYISIERQIGGPNDTIFQLDLDDTSLSVDYIGEWETSTQNTAFNNTLHGTVQAGSQVSITFPGCCIEVYGQYANANFTAVLDDQFPMTLTGFDVDLVVADQQPKTLLYLADNLDEEGNHTLILTNLDTKSNRPFYFDYAVVRSTHDISSGGNQVQGSATTTQLPPSTAAGNPSQPVAPTEATPAATIIGGVIGGLLALSLVLFLLYLLRRQQHSRTTSGRTSMEPVPYIVPRSTYQSNRSSKLAAPAPLGSNPRMPPQVPRPNSYSNVATGSTGAMSMLSSSATPAETSSTSHGRVSTSGIGTNSGPRPRRSALFTREVDAGITLSESGIRVDGAAPPTYAA